MGRKKARDGAFKCVYELEFNKEKELSKILEFCYDEHSNDEEEKEYIEKTLSGVNEHLNEIDAIILSKLKNWNMSRIAKIDLAILRLAIYEIKYTVEVPVKVVANEAVELAKQYGNNDSKSFVNGVIAQIIEDKDEEKIG